MLKYLLALCLTMTAACALAKDFEVTGSGSAAIASGNPQTVRALSLKAAKVQAVVAGINRINGADSTRDAKVAAKVPAIVDQIPDERFVNRRSQAIGDQYETSVTLLMDDKDFRTLLLDAGIAANDTTARSFTILAVMDEYLTTPRDLRAPLEELEEFSSDHSASFRGRSSSARSSRDASANVSASAARVGGYDGEGAYRGSAASVDASASVSSNSERSSESVAAQERDKVRYKRLVRYQPQNRGPEKTSLTYGALKGQLQDYDLKVLDNDMFKSTYFKNKPVTIEQLQNSAELARYVGFARHDAKADFFMLGTSVIVDSGRSDTTGEFLCTGVLTLKTFSTASGEDIASETTSETAAGTNANDCAAAVAKKMAAVGGPVISARVQEYWKRRSMYGREYLVTLQGSALPDAATRGLLKSVKGIAGVEKATLRSQTDSEYELVVVYKGDGLKDALDDQLDALPAFAARRSRVEADRITICLNGCMTAPAGVAKGKRK